MPGRVETLIGYFCCKKIWNSGNNLYIRARGSRIGVCLKDGYGLPLTFILDQRGTRTRCTRGSDDMNKLFDDEVGASATEICRIDLVYYSPPVRYTAHKCRQRPP